MKPPVILIVGQNAAWQKVCTLARLVRGEVNRVDQVLAFASSKGPNSARALTALGGVGEVLCYTGGATGELVRNSLLNEGVRASFAAVAEATRVCTTYVEPDGVTTELIEPSPVVTPLERAAFREMFRERLALAHVLLIAGSTVRGESEDCYAEMVHEAHRRSVTTILDSACPAGIRALEERPEVLKVNLRELGEMTGSALNTPPDRVRAWRAMASRHGIRWFLISKGAAGMEGFNGSVHLSAAPPVVPVINPIGSGDAASAGAAWRIHELLSSRTPAEIFGSAACLEDALSCATAMGTANCMNPMNGKVDQADYQKVRSGITVRRNFTR